MLPIGAACIRSDGRMYLLFWAGRGSPLHSRGTGGRPPTGDAPRPWTGPDPDRTSSSRSHRAPGPKQTAAVLASVNKRGHRQTGPASDRSRCT